MAQQDSEAGKQIEGDEQEIDQLYPKGTLERSVLDYSRSEHPHEEVPPLLASAFWILMGIGAMMVLACGVGFLSQA